MSLPFSINFGCFILKIIFIRQMALNTRKSFGCITVRCGMAGGSVVVRTYCRESILLESNFQNRHFNEITQFWGPLNQKITFLEVGLYICVCLCYQYNFKTNYNRNSESDILNLHHMRCAWYLKLFIKTWRIVCIQGHTKDSRTLCLVEGLSC